MTKKWRDLHCETDSCNYVHGSTDSVALIVGGCYIRQPRTNLLCTRCGRIKVFRSPSEVKILRFLTIEQVNFLIETDADIKDL